MVGLRPYSPGWFTVGLRPINLWLTVKPPPTHIRLRLRVGFLFHLFGLWVQPSVGIGELYFFLTEFFRPKVAHKKLIIEDVNKIWFLVWKEFCYENMSKASNFQESCWRLVTLIIETSARFPTFSWRLWKLVAFDPIFDWYSLRSWWRVNPCVTFSLQLSYSIWLPSVFDRFISIRARASWRRDVRRMDSWVSSFFQPSVDHIIRKKARAPDTQDPTVYKLISWSKIMGDDFYQPLTGHWRPNFSRTNLMIQTFGRLEKLSTVGSRHVIFSFFHLRWSPLVTG